MNKVFEEIIDELKQESIILDNDAGHRAVEIIQKIAEEYNGGWILCSERLPADRQDVLVCFDIDGCIIAWYSPSKHTWHVSATDNICKKEPVAWQPIPERYDKRRASNADITN